MAIDEFGIMMLYPTRVNKKSFFKAHGNNFIAQGSGDVQKYALKQS